MFNFNLPARGEPIDLTLMSQMATQLNEILAELNKQRMASSSLEAPARLRVETEDLTIWTGKILVVSNVQPVTDIATMRAVPWYASYDINFQSIPVVTATPMVTRGSGTSSNSCWITEITSTGCKGMFNYNVPPTQVEDVYVMVTAIGQGVV